MEQMEEKFNALLANPQLMQQLAAMAQSMGQQNPPREQEPGPCPDPKLLGQLSGMVKQSQTSTDEQKLLNALCPYLAKDRIRKLERAMRAAKMARLASGFLNSGGLQLLTGR